MQQSQGTQEKKTSASSATFSAALETSALIDIKRVLEITGYRSQAIIYKRARAGEFPQPIRLSARCTRWRVRDILNWIDAKAKAQGAA